jgi:hypothetical protein
MPGRRPGCSLIRFLDTDQGAIISLRCDGGMTQATITTTTALPRVRAKSQRTLGLFVVDVALLGLFVAVIEVPLTGLPIHEWLGIGFGVGMVAHLVQHAGWAGTTLKRIFGRTSFRNRLNYLMMAALFAGFASIIVSGLLISESALPALGLQPPAVEFWGWLHLASVVWVIALAALHIALNLTWFATTARRLLIDPLMRQKGTTR